MVGGRVPVALGHDGDLVAVPHKHVDEVLGAFLDRRVARVVGVNYEYKAHCFLPLNQSSCTIVLYILSATESQL